MPAYLGVVNTHGLTPATGYVSESSTESSIDPVPLKDENGVTVRLKPKKLITTNVSIKGKGTADFADVAAGAFSVDTVKIISAKMSEKNDDYPEFETVGKAYSNLA